jgi:hypothetical protein
MTAVWCLSFAAVIEEKGWRPDEHLWVTSVDVDSLAASMTFIQLALNGIPGAHGECAKR